MNKQADQEQRGFAPSTLSKDDQVILCSWNSREGRERLCRCSHTQDFFRLAHNFQPQINPLYCGIATIVILLNAMRIPKRTVPSQEGLEVAKPEALGGGVIPFCSYSQLTLLTQETDRVKSRDRINLSITAECDTSDASQFDPGLALAELKGVLEVYGVEVKIHYASDDIETGSSLFRKTVRSVLSDEKRFIAANFLGSAIGATTGGHISPLGAYDERSDSVLVLDVAGHKNPWYWAPVPHFYRAMHTKSGDAYRGWLVVSDMDGNPG